MTIMIEEIAEDEDVVEKRRILIADTPAVVVEGEDIIQITMAMRVVARKTLAHIVKLKRVLILRLQMALQQHQKANPQQECKKAERKKITAEQ